MTSEILNAGTSPITINPSQGFQSLTDLGGGAFQLFFGANNGGVPTFDTYVRLLDVTGVGDISGAGMPPAYAFLAPVVLAQDVVGASGNPSITMSTVCIKTSDGSLSLSNPPSDGSVLLVEITLSNTSAY